MPELFENLFAARVHMPAYFILLDFWSNVGASEFLLRFVSVLTSIIGVVLIFKIGSRIAGRRVGIIASSFLAISPFHIWFSQETRMYTMMVTLVLGVYWILFRILERPNKRHWLGYLWLMVLAAYTHYFTIFILATHYTFFSLHYSKMKKIFRDWIISAAAVAVLMGVWLLYMMSTGGFRTAPIGWIAPAGLLEPLMTYITFITGPSLTISPVVIGFAGLTVIACMGIVFWRMGRKGVVEKGGIDELDVYRARLLLTWLIVPVLLVYLISLPWPVPFKRSIYMDRYLIFVLPALFLVVAWALDLIRKTTGWPWPLLAGSGMVAALMISALPNIYNDPTYSREDWRSAVAIIDEYGLPDDALLIRPDHILPLDYYAGDDYLAYETPAPPPDDSLSDQFGRRMQGQIDLARETSGRIWLVTHIFNNDPHGFPTERNRAVDNVKLENQPKIWLDNHYPILGTWSVTGIVLTLYEIG